MHKNESRACIFALRTDRIQPLPQERLPIDPRRLAEISRMKHPQARRRSLGGELLLCWAVRQLGPAGVPIPPYRSLLPQGKPYFAENPAFHFSISHSGDWAVLVVAMAPVGVDIEQYGAARSQLVRRYFHPEEQAAFFALPEREQVQAFYRLWTLKESVVKALGTGMHLPFGAFAVSLDGVPRVSGLSGAASLALPPFNDPAYLLGICVLGVHKLNISTRLVTLDEVMS